ncbi:peptide MFS transporter [Niabella insulamsoli]|uniref:peptide MFS transporter n=1 Tax=Niabella insulamsoli TaxID=3144874 RepID=UPI0031FC2D66
MSATENDFFKSRVLGHPSGLFVLFFTEMWERFSYYGMRALLVLFFSASVLDSGWGWPKEHALAIFGTYTALVYLSTMLGGYFADKVIGIRWAVVVGALLMTLGHGSMALETPFFIYTGLVLLVFGSGFFKPNMTSIVSEMYKDHPEKKDGAYTIFYMGVNAGAFFGIMLCGYLGEKIGWSWGFGVAGIFMLFGLLQFWKAQNIFGNIGLKPVKEKATDATVTPEGGKLNPFTKFHMFLIVVCIGLGLAWILNDPVNKISEGAANLFDFQLAGISGSNVIILTALILFLVLLVSRISRYDKILRDRMIAIVFFAIITMIFWSIFEQAPGSLTLFAKDYTQRILEGTSGAVFKIVNSLITIVPLAIITWVLLKLFGQTFRKYKLSNIILSLSFIIIWGIAIWMVINEYKSTSYNIEYKNLNGTMNKSKVVSSNFYNDNAAVSVVDIENVSFFQPDSTSRVANNALTDKNDQYVGEVFTGTVTKLFEKEKPGAFGTVTQYAEVSFANASGAGFKRDVKLNKENRENLKVGDAKTILITHDIRYDNEQDSPVKATITSKESATEVNASWFNILNSLFIITLAPLFSRWWSSRYNPSANNKYAIGMLFLGIGMAFVAFGASSIVVGAKSASVSMIWLVFVYLFHTMGELCVSPVALSYVSKLVPGRMIAVMFGVWYLAVAIGNKLAGIFGEMSEHVADEKGYSYFFWMLTGISLAASLLSFVLGPVVKKLMHGVK